MEINRIAFVIVVICGLLWLDGFDFVVWFFVFGCRVIFRKCSPGHFTDGVGQVTRERAEQHWKTVHRKRRLPASSCHVIAIATVWFHSLSVSLSPSLSPKVRQWNNNNNNNNYWNGFLRVEKRCHIKYCRTNSFFFMIAVSTHTGNCKLWMDCRQLICWICLFYSVFPSPFPSSPQP